MPRSSELVERELVQLVVLAGVRPRELLVLQDDIVRSLGDKAQRARDRYAATYNRCMSVGMCGRVRVCVSMCRHDIVCICEYMWVKRVL